MNSAPYCTWGDASNPAIVLLHGFLGRADDWETVAQSLASDYYCIAIDLPGHGNAPIDDDESFATAAAGIIEVVDDCGADSFFLIGYSMGGRLALYMALQYAMRVDALILESASPGLASAEEREERRAWDDAKVDEILSTPLGEFARAWYAQPLFSSLANHPELREALISRRCENNREWIATAMRLLGTGRQESLWDELPEHRIRTLCIAGALDEKYRDIAQRMTEAAVDAQAVIIEDAGHNVHAERPDAFTQAVLAFLRGA